MTHRNPGFKRMIIAWLTASIMLSISFVLLNASSNKVVTNEQNPKWTRDLPAASCPWSSTDTNCHHASPVLADITGDGKQEIIVGTNNGYVVIYRYDGSLLWQIDIGPPLGMKAGTQTITASPAVGDIDHDGRMDVVVGAGTINGSICTQGGVIALNNDGKIKPGWPFLTKDDTTDPKGCRDSVYSSPALGDLDKDGDLEVVFGSFDKRLYAVEHNGQLVAGFPPDSNHLARFGWNVLKGRLADTIWSSPALSDLDNDGYLDIVVGSDEGNFDYTWQPSPDNWICPYQVPSTNGYCGGSIYAFDRFGRILDGFPRYKYEIIQSSPAIIDIDGKGQGDIFVGTGSYYYRVSPDKPTYGFRLFGMDSRGNDLRGWEGGKVVGGVVTASPSLGDITGDGHANIVVAAQDRRLYAWHQDGRMVSGFPMTPQNRWGQVLDIYNIGTGFILADYTGDGKMEIFLRHGWDIVIVDGKGRQVSARNREDSQPAYYASGPLWNNPAVGDLNGDGRLELVAQNSKLSVWDLPNSSLKADWPMFKRNAARTGMLQPSVLVAPEEFVMFAAQDEVTTFGLQMSIVCELGKFGWRVGSGNSPKINLPTKSGTSWAEVVIPVDVRVPRGMPLGNNKLGDISVDIKQCNGSNYEDTIPVRVIVMPDLFQSFSPFLQ